MASQPFRLAAAVREDRGSKIDSANIIALKVCGIEELGVAMGITQQREEHKWVIKFEGPITLSSAEDLKQQLMAWCSAGQDLELDLTHAGPLDISILQLLWACSREAAGRQVRLKGRYSEKAGLSLQESGFDCYLSFPVRSEAWQE